ncbi:hypothetical protein NDU88_001962 [Pleurodeles waltl]|uniref:Uncharacterized protein n=1 Tax=Pleurodeles waltl TaxID=8319 RepID=A0AAV7T1T6_PLEWA|nr:hypothetical protein NDU88_001962 [Pleurodeles waltl]
MEDECVKEAIRFLHEAGRTDLLVPGLRGMTSPPHWASVAADGAAVVACSPPLRRSEALQVCPSGNVQIDLGELGVAQWPPRRKEGKSQYGRQDKAWDKFDAATQTSGVALVVLQPRRTVNELQEKYELDPSEYFRYLQVQHALHLALPKGTEQPETTPLERRLLEELKHKKAISLTYKTILNNSLDTLQHLKQQWQQNLGELEEEEWEEVLASLRDVGIYSSFHLI